MRTRENSVKELDVLVVGAGFAGLYMLHRLRQMGLMACVLERGGGVGGTWYWNRYPGARCDVESLEYSYKFDERLQREWTWSERYAAQPEILRYLNHVADRFQLRDDIQLNTTVNSAVYDEATHRWQVGTSEGEKFESRFFIAATGCLSQPIEPRYPGQDNFQGEIYYTSRWPEDDVDFSGKNVAIIGTGSSGIQTIPIVARQARHLAVLQRTPNFSVPACNRPLTEEEIAKTKAQYTNFRAHCLSGTFGFQLYPSGKTSKITPTEQIESELERRWNVFGGLQFLGGLDDMLFDSKANAIGADFIRKKIRRIVNDPSIAEKLIPNNHAVGCKRLCSDTGYYETFNRDNVELVDLKQTPVDGIEERGIRCGNRLVEADAIIYATGFDAMTGALLNMNISTRRGRSLNDAWREGARTYLGLMTAGFPNFFMITGPGSPSVLTNMVMAIEDHVDWIANCLTYLYDEKIVEIEADHEAQSEWMERVKAIAEPTQFTGCNSWYAGSNVAGKPHSFTVYVGFSEYRSILDDVSKGNEFSGFSVIEQHSLA